MRVHGENEAATGHGIWKKINRFLGIRPAPGGCCDVQPNRPSPQGKIVTPPVLVDLTAVAQPLALFAFQFSSFNALSSVVDLPGGVRLRMISSLFHFLRSPVAFVAIRWHFSKIYDVSVFVVKRGPGGRVRLGIASRKACLLLFLFN